MSKVNSMWVRLRVPACAGFVVLALLFAAASQAEDFRQMKFGAQCEGIEARETTLGSKPDAGKLPSGYQFAFKNREHDRDVIVAYSCRDGVFYRGAYIFDAADESDAARLYATLKRRVSEAMGPPYYDFSSAQHRKKMADVGAELSKVDTLVSFWKNDTYEAHASVAEPRQERGWRVSLSYTALSALEE